MKNKKGFKSALIVSVFVIIFALIVFKFFYKNNNDENFTGFFEQMISIENYELFINGDYEKLTGSFEGYCNDRGLNSVFYSRQVIYNYDFIYKYNIKSYKNLKAELIEESASDDTLFRDYKITYTYMDDSSKEYELTDYYRLNIKENKIDYVKLDIKNSTVGKLFDNSLIWHDKGHDKGA